MAVSAADVKKLRDATGAGMMDCKKALEEADGDFDKAVEILRVKGAAKAAKRSGEREATNGLVAAADGAMIALASETDFVAKNEEFQSLASDIVALAASTHPADAAALAQATLADGRTVEQAIEQTSAVIGEKLALGDVAVFEGKTTTYLHKRATDLPPQIGVLVAFEGDDAETARGVAMQIATYNPPYLSRDEVPAETVEKERRIAEATAREEGKPEQALPKIVEGRLTGFYKDNVLLDQAYVRDNKKSVQAVLDEAGVKITKFARFAVGA
ncbi:MAG TPA: translation elongation factor Ts [Mycobacteriales bacterium]|nr:translation elongation factor Ts [Mycobacteriales bacterium]